MTEFRAYRRALTVMGILTALVLCGWSVLILTWMPAQEFLHREYRQLLWIGLVLGMAPSVLYLSQHRPSRWFSSTSLNANGWVIVIFLLYVRGGVSLALQHDSLLWRGPGNALNSLGFLLAIDLLLIFRVISFMQYRLTFRNTQREMELRRAKAAQDAVSSRSED